jgi:hypothetical protein
MSTGTAQTAEGGGVLPSDSCPTCSHRLDSATPLPNQGNCRPRPGDLTVCVKCGEALEYTEAMFLKIATVSHLMGLPSEQQAAMSKAQKLIRERRFIK